MNVPRTRSRTSDPHRAAGFTLLELMLVLGLLLLLTILVWPALQQWTINTQMPESTENLRSTLRMARATACMTGRRVRLRWEVKQQQPVIEYEVDPTEKPGEWKACEESWIDGAVMLGDVQVAEIKPGRPDIMTPVSHTQGMSERELFEQDVVVSDDEAARSDEEKQKELGGLGADFEVKEENEPDPARPTITFEVDGSSDWYTLIVARGQPGEPADLKVRQTWIILDGRTGLPRVHEPLTDEQSADLALRPDLDKLQPPETSLEDMTLTAGLDLGAALGGADGAGADGAAALGEEGLDGSQAGGLIDDALAGGQDGSQGGGLGGSGGGDSGMGGAGGGGAGAGSPGVPGSSGDSAGGDQPNQDQNTSGSRSGGSRRGGSGKRGTSGADGGATGGK